MQWHSVSEFFEMGGYAFYVWGSFGACAVAMLVEPWLLRQHNRSVIRSLKRQQRANAGAA
ncbi:heme exporter protein CcmD [Piscinibacter sp.]|jgi:heme exporter protein D|uniref:heme exporter protein CcmD n=1 Tax=Piscinibacter sp. TaxID=1903157 RepID=UPI00355A2AEF